MLKLLVSLVLLAPAAARADEPLRINFEGRTYSVGAPSAALPAMDKAFFSLPGAKAAKKKWTVMVFVNGKNDLESAGLLNLNMMELVGSNKDVSIVAEIGRMKGQAQGDTADDGDWTGSRRIYVQKDDDMEKIKSPAVMTTPTVDMGDYKRAVDFVKWSKKNYRLDGPAQGGQGRGFQ